MKHPIGVVAVDDEPLALELLCDLLAKDDAFELLGRCGEGKAALRLIRHLQPEVAFLDIEMPERGGLEVAKALAAETAPEWVFVTAFSQHAADAFEVAALDYLVKPFSDQRFFAVMERVKRRVQEKRIQALATQMASLSQGLTEGPSIPDADAQPSEAPLRRIPVQTSGRTLLIDDHEILWIESCDYYARLHTCQGSHLVRIPLATFEQRLDPQRFVRLHRQTIVNLRQVREVHPLLKGKRQVVLRDGTTLAISRSRLRRIERLLMPDVRR